MCKEIFAVSLNWNLVIVNVQSRGPIACRDNLVLPDGSFRTVALFTHEQSFSEGGGAQSLVRDRCAKRCLSSIKDHFHSAVPLTFSVLFFS